MTMGARVDREGALVCMMCGRTVARVHHGRAQASTTGHAIRREGRQLRCGHCRGNVYLDVDVTARSRRDDDLEWEEGARRSASAGG